MNALRVCLSPLSVPTSVPLFSCPAFFTVYCLSVCLSVCPFSLLLLLHPATDLDQPQSINPAAWGKNVLRNKCMNDHDVRCALCGGGSWFNKFLNLVLIDIHRFHAKDVSKNTHVTAGARERLHVQPMFIRCPRARARPPLRPLVTTVQTSLPLVC